MPYSYFQNLFEETKFKKLSGMVMKKELDSYHHTDNCQNNDRQGYGCFGNKNNWHLHSQVKNNNSIVSI